MSLHIAFIMDGNRRWAVSQGMSKLEGHKHGAENLKTIIRWGKNYGLSAMTFYTFSTENFNRSELEKKMLFELVKRFVKELDKEEDLAAYRIHFVGRLHLFPADVQEAVNAIQEKTKEGNLPLYFCFGYGGRQEIVDACNKAIAKGEPVTDETFGQHLYFDEQPDIVIRTGGAMRTSNFLPWQAAYAEWFFPETFWPALTPTEVEAIITSFNERTRNFGR